MSNIFLKNNLKNNSTNLTSTESSIKLPKQLTIVNKYTMNDNVTSSVNMSQLNKTSSATSTFNNNDITSSMNMSQLNNPYSATSTMNMSQLNNKKSLNLVGGGSSSSINTSHVNNNDINNLISMLTSESNNSTTNTESLENKLQSLLLKGGGQNLETELLENKLQSVLQKDVSQSLDTETLEYKLRNFVKNSNQQNMKGGNRNMKGGNELLKLGVAAVAGAAAGSALTASYYNNNKDDENKSITENKCITETSSDVDIYKILNMNTNEYRQSKSPNEIFINNDHPPSKSPNEIFINNALITTTDVIDASPTSSMRSRNDYMPSTTSSDIRDNYNFRKPINNSTKSTDYINSDSYNRYIESQYKKISDQNVSRESPKQNIFEQGVSYGSQYDDRRSQYDDRRLSDLQSSLRGGGKANPALKAFAELSSLVSIKLNIKNGPNAKKIAGQLQRDIKEKNSDIKTSEILNAAKSHLEKNMEKYKKMIK